MKYLTHGCLMMFTKLRINKNTLIYTDYKSVMIKLNIIRLVMLFKSNLYSSCPSQILYISSNMLMVLSLIEQ